jgi:hypothetical protein
MTSATHRAGGRGRGGGAGDRGGGHGSWAVLVGDQSAIGDHSAIAGVGDRRSAAVVSAPAARPSTRAGGGGGRLRGCKGIGREEAYESVSSKTIKSQPSPQAHRCTIGCGLQTQKQKENAERIVDLRSMP